MKRSLVFFKVHLCLDLPFFLLSGTVAYARFIQPEQKTRRVWPPVDAATASSNWVQILHGI